MSSVYVLEPPTKGKVVLKTTCGPLDIELWAKEAPKSTRNFVQLCMEGYYNGTIFHRIIKDFLVQGGDPTGTGKGGESIYGEPFADEIHTRLKFRHRGFVACANENEKDTNGSQFFITLDRCDWLNGKNTIFGKVTGDTIYNLLKLGESETGDDDRPLEPHTILSAEILWNPFDDIVPRKRIKTVETPAAAQEEKPVKQKKRLNLLSFGEEALQEEEVVSAVNTKMKSSHDVLDDPRLLKSQHPEATEEDDRRKQKELSAVKQALAIKGTSKKQPMEPADDQDVQDEDDFDAKMRLQILEKRKRYNDVPGIKEQGSDDRASKKSKNEEPQKEKDDSDEEEDDDDEDDTQIRKHKLVMKKHGVGSEAKAEMAIKRDVEMQLLTPQQQQRQKYKQQKRNLQGREEATIALLNKFREKLVSSKTNATTTVPDESPEPEPESEPERNADPMDELESEAGDNVGWISHKLKFQENKKDKMARNDDIDHYVVVDPLLEKGKEQFNKMQAKAKRRTREWAGRSYT